MPSEVDNAAQALLATLVAMFMVEGEEHVLEACYDIDVEDPDDCPLDEAVARYYRAVMAMTDEAALERVAQAVEGMGKAMERMAKVVPDAR